MGLSKVDTVNKVERVLELRVTRKCFLNGAMVEQALRPKMDKSDYMKPNVSIITMDAMIC